MKILTIMGVIFLAMGNWGRAVDEGWVELFDGATLVGWTPNFKDQRVEVRNGVIEMRAVKKNRGLVHEAESTDFELEGEIKAPLENYNTGITLRCDQAPLGYPCEVFDRQSGSLYAIPKGWVCPPSERELKRFYEIGGGRYKPGEWNHDRIKCVGTPIRIG